MSIVVVILKLFFTTLLTGITVFFLDFTYVLLPDNLCVPLGGVLWHGDKFGEIPARADIFCGGIGKAFPVILVIVFLFWLFVFMKLLKKKRSDKSKKTNNV